MQIYDNVSIHKTLNVWKACKIFRDGVTNHGSKSHGFYNNLKKILPPRNYTNIPIVIFNILTF